MAYSFQAKVTARGYHIYKNTTWEDAKCGDKILTDLEMDEKTNRDWWLLLNSKTIKTIKTIVGQPQKLKAVVHIPKEISRYVYFFLKEEKGQIHGTFHSVNYRPSIVSLLQYWRFHWS